MSQRHDEAFRIIRLEHDDAVAALRIASLTKKRGAQCPLRWLGASAGGPQGNAQLARESKRICAWPRQKCVPLCAKGREYVKQIFWPVSVVKIQTSKANGSVHTHISDR
jgi:hypothetical protein